MTPGAGWLGIDGTFLSPKACRGIQRQSKSRELDFFYPWGPMKVEDAINAAKTLRKVLRQVQDDRK